MIASFVRRFTERNECSNSACHFVSGGEWVARMRFSRLPERSIFPGVIKYGSRRFYFGAGPSSVAK